MVWQPVSLSAWLKDHDRAVYDSIRPVFSVADYIRLRGYGAAAGNPPVWLPPVTGNISPKAEILGKPHGIKKHFKFLLLFSRIHYT
jgi:hypothetical protein